MAAAGSIANKLIVLWKCPYTRTYLPHLFLFISVLGSLLKYLELVSQSYFSNSRNVLNVYFVKVSWGWTLVLLLPFIYLSNSYKRSRAFVLKRLTSLLVATLIWYICTETFFYIEDVTGECQANTLKGPGEITTKAACKKAGMIWDGFDISGHSFILTFSALIIVEEMVAMLQIPNSHRNTFLDCLYIALNVIVAIWIWMFACTSVYFHHFIDKLLGTSVGVLGWYVTYGVWYPKFSLPGLPPQPNEQKEHA
ncbi:Fat storage-inducing transmembrane protein 2 [Triplophysa tibetana]|uniref:Fat storage-inducing transmembrane protein 2 n=1 Tax=Triplophysa tibetana TaxID=1572043 RepID=A0A5A9NCL0_9TELE|nr:Fat storage-inducing transmembrane protein 2 [Triplophysa tibetana]